MQCVTGLENSSQISVYFMSFSLARISPAKINYMTWKTIFQFDFFSCNGLHDQINCFVNLFWKIRCRWCSLTKCAGWKCVCVCQSSYPVQKVGWIDWPMVAGLLNPGREVFVNSLFPDLSRKKCSNRWLYKDPLDQFRGPWGTKFAETPSWRWNRG